MCGTRTCKDMYMYNVQAFMYTSNLIVKQYMESEDIDSSVNENGCNTTMLLNCLKGPLQASLRAVWKKEENCTSIF